MHIRDSWRRPDVSMKLFTFPFFAFGRRPYPGLFGEVFWSFYPWINPSTCSPGWHWGTIFLLSWTEDWDFFFFISFFLFIIFTNVCLATDPYLIIKSEREYLMTFKSLSICGKGCHMHKSFRCMTEATVSFAIDRVLPMTDPPLKGTAMNLACTKTLLFRKLNHRSSKLNGFKCEWLQVNTDLHTGLWLVQWMANINQHLYSRIMWEQKKKKKNRILCSWRIWAPQFVSYGDGSRGFLNVCFCLCLGQITKHDFHFFFYTENDPIKEAD